MLILVFADKTISDAVSSALAKHMGGKAEIAAGHCTGEIAEKEYDIAFIHEAYASAITWIKAGEAYMLTDREIKPSVLLRAIDMGFRKALRTDDAETEIKAIAKRRGFDAGTEDKESETGKTASNDEATYRRGKSRHAFPEYYASRYSALVITVFGAKGGTGKTSAAINLAASLAEKNIVRVGLVDFDTRNSSSVANKLSMRYAKSVLDFIESVDCGNISDVMIYHPAGFYVLPGLPDETESRSVTAEVIDKIIRFASLSLDVIIADVSSMMEIPTLRALEICDAGYIVADMSPDGFDRMLGLPLPDEICMKLQLVINKADVRLLKNIDHVIKQVEEEKHIPFLCSIRYDPCETAAWWHANIPVLDGKCKAYREDFKAVADDVMRYIKVNHPRL